MNAKAESVKPLTPPAGHKAAEVPVAPLAPPAAPKAAKEPKAPKAPKEPKPPRVSNFEKIYPEGAKITLKVEKNPKREGSLAYGRFAFYANGMTVAEALKAGVTYADISWDVGHGFIAVG